MEEVIDLRESEFDKEKLKGLANPITNFIFNTDIAIIFIGRPTEYSTSSSIAFLQMNHVMGDYIYFWMKKVSGLIWKTMNCSFLTQILKQ